MPLSPHARDSRLVERIYAEQFCGNTTTAMIATHIRLDEHGVAWIENTKIKVIEKLVLDKLAHGSSSEEIHF